MRTSLSVSRHISQQSSYEVDAGFRCCDNRLSFTERYTAPHYLAADLRRLSDMPSRRRLRASLTDQLDIRQSQRSTVGDRAFAVAGARLWNSLPHDIVASDTLSHFRRGFKTFLFRQSYPSILF